MGTIGSSLKKKLSDHTMKIFKLEKVGNTWNFLKEMPYQPQNQQSYVWTQIKTLQANISVREW